MPDSVAVLCQRPLVEVRPRDTLRAVARTLTEESVGVAVVSGSHRPGDGPRVHGLISERDIVAALAEGADPDEVWAEDAMTDDLASASPDWTLHDAAAHMLHNEIRHLPVTAEGTIVGIVSMRDVLQAEFGTKVDS
jgi:signal-transduction protein with cAMP-binding, CBS, and nucleotidyltransferase domain